MFFRSEEMPFKQVKPQQKRKLRQLLKIPPAGSGECQRVQVSDSILENTILVLNNLPNTCKNVKILPTTTGGVFVRWGKNDEYSFTTQPDNTITVCTPDTPCTGVCTCDVSTALEYLSH